MSVFNKNGTQKSLNMFAIAGLSTAIAFASGCSSDDPDQGSALSTTSISGIAIDGYISAATVYLDLNNNGRRNAGEPGALTDKDGYFSTGKDGTNYCAGDAFVAEKIHCLKAVETGEKSILRISGGVDLFTGDPFEGILSARVIVADTDVIENQVISPLTSMLAEITDENEQADILASFGLGLEDLQRDFLVDDVDPAKGFDATTTQTAIKLHKVVTIVAEALDEKFKAFGEESGFPASTNVLIYKALAQQVLNNSVIDQIRLTAAFDLVQDDIAAIYAEVDDDDLPMPARINNTARDIITSNAMSVLGLVETILPADMSFSQIQTRVIGVEMVVRKILNGDSDVANAITEAENPDSDLYDAILETLTDPDSDVDFSALAGINYNQAQDFSTIAIEGAISFSGLGGRQLSLTHAQDSDGISGGAHFFFNEGETATSGTLNLCLMYQDDQEDKIEETEGVLFNGTWSAMADTRLSISLERALNVDLISKGLVNNRDKYSLSYAGESLTWLSDNTTGLLGSDDAGFVAELPATSDECAKLLTPQF